MKIQRRKILMGRCEMIAGWWGREILVRSRFYRHVCFVVFGDKQKHIMWKNEVLFRPVNWERSIYVLVSIYWCLLISVRGVSLPTRYSANCKMTTSILLPTCFASRSLIIPSQIYFRARITAPKKKFKSRLETSLSRCSSHITTLWRIRPLMAE